MIKATLLSYWYYMKDMSVKFNIIFIDEKLIRVPNQQLW
jgi:hypothetical protein